MRKVLALVAVAAFAALLGLVPASPAYATDPTCHPTHCFGIAMYRPAFYLGNVSGHIKLTEQYDNIADGQSFVTQEFWMWTEWADFYCPSRCWVETGATSGYCDNLPDAPYCTLTPGTYIDENWYEADARPSSTGAFNYHEHYATFYTYNNTDYATGIHNHGGGVYYAQRSDVGGTWFTSTGNPAGAGLGADAGVELDENGDNVDCGTITSLAYQVSGDTTQIFGWPGATLHDQNPPVSAAWTSTYNNLKLQANATC